MPAHRVFGEDRFGKGAEAAARFFGTPLYIVGQTLVVALWIVVNAIAVGMRWDPYPFILLNLVFSTQAAYAAPLILLAQTRQADRDKLALEQTEAHRDSLIERVERQEEALRQGTVELKALLTTNTELTRQDTELTQEVERLAREIRTHVAGRSP